MILEYSEIYGCFYISEKHVNNVEYGLLSDNISKEKADEFVDIIKFYNPNVNEANGRWCPKLDYVKEMFKDYIEDEDWIYKKYYNNYKKLFNK